MAEAVLSLADKTLAMFPSSFEEDKTENWGMETTRCAHIRGGAGHVVTMVITISSPALSEITICHKSDVAIKRWIGPIKLWHSDPFITRGDNILDMNMSVLSGHYDFIRDLIRVWAAAVVHSAL